MQRKFISRAAVPADLRSFALASANHFIFQAFALYNSTVL
jgi:hypothetical protein